MQLFRRYATQTDELTRIDAILDYSAGGIGGKVFSVVAAADELLVVREVVVYMRAAAVLTEAGYGISVAQLPAGESLNIEKVTAVQVDPPAAAVRSFILAPDTEEIRDNVSFSAFARVEVEEQAALTAGVVKALKATITLDEPVFLKPGDGLEFAARADWSGLLQHRFQVAGTRRTR